MVDLYLFREDADSDVVVRTIERDEEEEKEEKALFCRFCGKQITELRFAIEMSDDHHHTFFNPAGIIYEIRCFSQAEGCVRHGPSTDEFSWFPGYTWRLALCSECFVHMGWYFSSGTLGFYGLIGKNLVS